MLKYALTLCVLIPIILAQSQESSSEEASISGSHSLFKIYPKQSLQVEFLKKYAIGSGQSNGPQSTRAQIITPLAAGKTGYALVPISSSEVFTQMLRRKHIKSKFVDVTTINSFTVDNSMHEPSEFPPPRRQSHYNQLQLRDPYPEDYIIQSPRITNKGAWGLWATCVTNSYAIGFILKTQQLDKTVDNTALNAIKLLCAPYPQLPADQAVEIQSLEGDYGDWGRKFTCPKGSHANAFQLRSEQEGAGDGDDSGANNFKVFCSDRFSTEVDGDGLSFGDWTEKKSCLKHQGICGIRSQVQKHGEAADIIGLNNVDLVCCDLPLPPRA